MAKIRHIILLTILAVFIFSSSFAQDESLTFTTYYPSPYGVYKELRLSPNTSPNACDENNEGAMYYDDAQNQPMVCQQTGISYEWEPLGGGGYWQSVSSGTSGQNMITPVNWPSNTIQISNRNGQPFACTNNTLGAEYYDTGTGTANMCIAGGWTTITVPHVINPPYFCHGSSACYPPIREQVQRTTNTQQGVLTLEHGTQYQYRDGQAVIGLIVVTV